MLPLLRSLSTSLSQRPQRAPAGSSRADVAAPSPRSLPLPVPLRPPLLPAAVTSRLRRAAWATPSCASGDSAAVPAARRVAVAAALPAMSAAEASAPDGATHAAAAAAPSASAAPQPSPASAIDFLMLLQQLKLTKRTGWVRKDVAGPESIADHMYRMSMMALIATDSAVDVNRCIKMALVHDVAEAVVGDITPHCGVSDADKHAAEAAAVERMQRMLGAGTAAAAEVGALWAEYEAAASPEALLVKDFDKLEMIITAHQYEQAQPGLALDEFFASTVERFKTDTGRAWASELVKRRTEGKAAAAAGAAAGAAAQGGVAADGSAAAAAAADRPAGESLPQKRNRSGEHV